MQDHLQSVKSVIDSLECVPIQMVFCTKLAKQLHMNAMTSVELCQEYCAMRADQTVHSH
jgi:hypothetical protein